MRKKECYCSIVVPVFTKQIKTSLENNERECWTFIWMWIPKKKLFNIHSLVFRSNEISIVIDTMQRRNVPRFNRRISNKMWLWIITKCFPTKSIFKNWKKMQMCLTSSLFPLRCKSCATAFYVFIRMLSLCPWWIKIRFHKNMPFVVVTTLVEMSSECVLSARLGIQIDTIVPSFQLLAAIRHLSYPRQRQMTEHQCHLSKNSRDSIIYLSQLTPIEIGRGKKIRRIKTLFYALHHSSVPERAKKNEPKNHFEWFPYRNQSLIRARFFIHFNNFRICMHCSRIPNSSPQMNGRDGETAEQREKSMENNIFGCLRTNCMCTTFSTQSLGVVVAVVIVD